MLQVVTCLLLLPSALTLSSRGGRALKRVRKTRINDNSVVLENYDKETLRTMLERRAKQVGDVVLVNGKPAIIKRRPQKITPNKNQNVKKRVHIKLNAKSKSDEVKPTRLATCVQGAGACNAFGAWVERCPPLITHDVLAV